jgi:erythromycin esterase
VQIRIVRADGQPAAGAFVLATRLGSEHEQLMRADASGMVELDARPAALAVASADGFLFVPEWRPTQVDRLALDTDCVSLQGRVVDGKGDLIQSEVVLRLRRSSDQQGDSFFLAARGTVAGCVPAAQYVLSAEGGAFVGSTVLLEIDSNRATLPEYHASERARVVAPPPEEVTTSLREHVVQDSQLERLLPTLGAARVIGCGEANHGSAEPYRMRQALFGLLASDLDSRLLLIEAGLGETIALDRYLQTGEGDLAALVAGMHFWIWDTEEFTAVLHSIRERNAAAPPEARIHVLGVDIQFSDGAWAVAREHIAVDRREQLAFLEGRDSGEKFLAMTAAQRGEVLSILDETARTARDGDELWWAVRALRLFLDYVVVTDTIESFSMRDRMMAENVLAALARKSGGPAVLWAHSAHVAREPYYGMTTMGMLLGEELGATYVPMTYLTGVGSLRAWDTRMEIGVVEQPLDAPPPHAVEGLLRQVNAPSFYVDLRGEGPFRAWFDVPRYEREVGSTWPGTGSEFVLRNMPMAFDLIGFAQESSGTHPTATGVRKAGH